MYGEINVAEVMDRAERLKVWRARQARDAEWVALKQWWKAERMVWAAEGEPALKQALEHRSHTARLYRAELQRAWPKWVKVQRELNARRKHAQLA